MYITKNKEAIFSLFTLFLLISTTSLQASQTEEKEEEKSSIESVLKSSSTLFQEAINQKSIKRIKLLFKDDNNKLINERITPSGDTPLMFVVNNITDDNKKSLLSIFKYLLAKPGVDLLATNDVDENLFHCLARAGATKFLQEIEKFKNNNNSPFLYYHKKNVNEPNHSLDLSRAIKEKKNKDFQSALMVAAKCNRAQFVGHLIENHNADASELTKLRMNAFHLAALHGCQDTVCYFFDETDIDPLIVDSYGRNILGCLVASKNVTLVNFVLKKYSKALVIGRTKDNFNKITPQDIIISTRANNGKNLLHIAALSNAILMMDMLINEYGMDVNEQDLHGRTCAHLAASNGHILVLEYLKKKGVIPDGKCLTWAITRGHLETVIYLLGQNIFLLSSKVSEGQNMLQWAVSCGQKEIFDYLRKKYATPPQLMKHYPIQKDQLTMSLHIINDINRGLLLSAVDNNQVIMAKYLLSLNKHFISLKNQDKLGRDPYLLSIFRGHQEMFLFLKDEYKKRGLAPKKVDNYGRDASLLATCNNNVTFFKYLKDNNHIKVNKSKTSNNGRSYVLLSIHYGCKNMLYHLINDLKMSINCTDNKGNNIYHTAIMQGNIKLFMYLKNQYQHELSIHSKNNDGMNLLSLTAFAGKKEAFTYLLNHLYKNKIKCLYNEDKKQKVFDTTFANLQMDFLGCSAFGGQTEMVNFLTKEHNMDVFAKNKNGYNPLSYAIIGTQIKMIDYLTKPISDGGTFEMNINKCRNNLEQGPALIAVVHGNIKVLDHLITHNCQIDIKDKMDRNIIHTAVHYNQYNMLLHLLKNYFDRTKVCLNRQDNKGNTPFDLVYKNMHSYKRGDEVQWRTANKIWDLLLSCEKNYGTKAIFNKAKGVLSNIPYKPHLFLAEHNVSSRKMVISEVSLLVYG